VAEPKFTKSDIHLDGVPQTLLMPLLGRAKFSKEAYFPIKDPMAIQLVKALNYNFEELEKRIGYTAISFIVRAHHFDQAIKKYLQAHPNGTIVNLGAGLETAFFRVDNQKLTWIDLDLPEVIHLREKLIPRSNQVHSIAKSILDYSWMEDVKKFGNEFFFFAGGLLFYFNEEEVKALLKEMARRFPKSEFLFDTISSKDLRHGNILLAKSNMADAPLRWPLDDAAGLEQWSSQIKIINQTRYFRGLEIKKALPLFWRVKMFLGDFMSKPHLIHLKFSEGEDQGQSFPSNHLQVEVKV
jgi:O-methyltransferase involved in polyketide biosynthesis